MSLAIPTIHMNGTSKKALLTDYCDAIDALHEAGRKLAATCPNGRDYYTQGNTALGAALNQHENRMNKLRDWRIRTDRGGPLMSRSIINRTWRVTFKSADGQQWERVTTIAPTKRLALWNAREHAFGCFMIKPAWIAKETVGLIRERSQ